MLLERWDSLSRLGGAEPEILRSQAARHLWPDIVRPRLGEVLLAGVRAVGAGRLLLGSDFPYQTGRMYTYGAIGFISESGIGHADVSQILGANAAGLFGLRAAEQPPASRRHR
jgi:aminocarboxymuconate-semialdehyde decarboxylase